MKLVPVFHSKKYDIVVKDDYVKSKFMATAAYIATNGLVQVKEGMLEVPESSLDSEGRYIVTADKHQQ